MLSAIVFPFTIQKLQNTKLNSYTSQLSADIYFQQQESFYKNSSRGIAFTENGYLLFDGESLGTSTETSDVTLPRNITITPVDFTVSSEFYFPQGEFRPSSSGHITLFDGFNTINIYVNSEGLIYHE